VVLPDESLLVISAWTMAAWLISIWDKFPHLAISSPEKRCGKTLLLDLLFLIVPRGRYTTNVSPAALYRLIQAERPTLLMDESQSISRRGSEAAEVVRELLNGGVGRNARVLRCGGDRYEQIQEFSVYCPKAFALIGAPDAVLADRCLPITLVRKTDADFRKRYRSRIVDPIGKKLAGKIQQWAKENSKKVASVYDKLEPFPIENDRMAELLMPLQAVLSVSAPGAMDLLARYAHSLDERDRQQENQTPGVRLLAACRDEFKGIAFMATTTLISRLVDRSEEPWGRWNHGSPITAEALANLLRPYGIKSARNKDQTARGYYAADFCDAWARYLVSLKKPSIPANPSIPTTARKRS
jgi:hypothetical protein